MVTFTFTMVSAICCRSSAISNGSLLGMVAPGGRRRRGVGAAADAEIVAADQPLGFDRGERVQTHQLMQRFGDFEFDAELAAGRDGGDDLRDRAGLGTGHPDDPARLQPRDLLELRGDGDLLRERHLTVADHEEADREQRQAAEDEDADADQTRRIRHQPPACDRMNACTSGSSLASSS
jgi:hypothetical protein